MNYTLLCEELTKLSTKSGKWSAEYFFKKNNNPHEQFLGVTVPHIRLVAKKYQLIDAATIAALLHNPHNEIRLLGLIIMVHQYRKASEEQKTSLYQLYLAQRIRINNWNLVDQSAYHIVGDYIFHHPEHTPILDELAASLHWFERRIAIISTLYFIRKNQYDLTLSLAKQLIKDQHDLMHKAIGWMLREVGKRNEELLIQFLQLHYAYMPSTMRNYATEKLSLPIKNQLRSSLLK